MVTFYRGEEAFITHEVFATRRPDPRSFTIRELAAVHVVDENREAIFPRAAAIGLGAIVLAVAVIKGSVDSTSMWTVLALVAVLIPTVSVGCMRHQRNYELRAIYRGRLVCLLATHDARVLGQVVRALRRAAEWNLDPR